MNLPINVPLGSPTTKVLSSTSVKDYVPFTVLPAAFHGKRVAIVIVPDDFGKDDDGDAETA